MASQRVFNSEGMVQARWKLLFFDSEAVIRNIEPKERQALAKFGAYTRQRAKRSIRNRKKASAPGQPPSSHKGTLRKGIFAGIDTVRRSVVIGPVRYQIRGNAPATLEHGGMIAPYRNPRRRARKVGDGGIVRIDTHGGTSKEVIDSFGKKRSVTFARLSTPNMVSLAERIEGEIYGPMMLGGNIAARPYMGPAFMSELAEHPPSFT